jgi:hypothetical protein
MSSLTLRRSIVILATVASLFGGAVAIRAAAGWTAVAAPLAAPPDPAALVTALQNEKARADAIASELSQVVGKAGELHDALAAAQQKAATDAKSAADLAAKLAAAQKRLATLQAQLSAPPPAAPPAAAPTAAPPAGHDGPGDD